MFSILFLPQGRGNHENRDTCVGDTFLKKKKDEKKGRMIYKGEE